MKILTETESEEIRQDHLVRLVIEGLVLRIGVEPIIDYLTGQSYHVYPDYDTLLDENPQLVDTEQPHV